MQPIGIKDHLELLDCTGRIIKKSKHGSISSTADLILKRLGYTPDKWVNTKKPEHPWMRKVVRCVESIKDYSKAIGQRWIWQ